jgi:hypothetical protein
MTLSRRVTVLIFALVLGFAATASAQFARGMRKDPPVPPAAIDEPSAWGLNSPTVITTSTLDAVPLFTTGSFNPISGQNGFASCASGFCFWAATVRVPSGVSIRAIELSACDGDGVAEVEASLGAGPKVPGNPVDVTPTVATGGAATPGCSTFLLNLAAPVTIDNNNFFYAIQVGAEAGTNVSWSQVRLRYRLQVSPAPGTATFAHVPLGHPQRQFIEALVASGVTGGCGGSNYCPDAPVTRGQMAVFLSAALGLHWPF